MKLVEVTLLEQMHITEVEIARRKALFGFALEEEELLQTCHYMIAGEIDQLVGEFYERQTSIDEISLVIGDADTLGRLQNAMKVYVDKLFSGDYGLDYVNNRLRIGLVHKRIGVEPKLYMAAMSQLREVLFDKVKEKMGEKSDRVILALDKLLNFDITLVFDTYIRSLVQEVESAKNKAEDYAQGLEEKVSERTRQLKDMARQDELTGLYNFKAFREFLERDLAMAQRNKTSLCLVYFDVDKFKQINDIQGHQAGDLVLRAVAQCLKNDLRETDAPCRYGGDEFCAILPGDDLKTAITFCERFVEHAKTCFDVTLSIGIAQTGPEKFVSADLLIKMADEQMYKSKGVEGFHISYDSGE